MNKCSNMTEERLDEMLKDALNSEKSIEEDNLRPPVINTYGLEKERLRREKKLLITITSITAVILTFSLAICGWFITKIYSVQIHELITKWRKTSLYLSVSSIIAEYGTEIKAALVSMLLIFILSFLLSSVLLVKNKNKLLHQH